MAWTEEMRRARARREFLVDQEQYIKACAFTGEAARRDTRRVMAEWIVSRMQPNLMATLTFPELFGGNQKRRWYMNDFLSKWMARGRYVWAVEPHRSGVVHGHAIGHQEGLRRLSMHDAWRVETGGFALVEQVRSVEDAVMYVVGYILKNDDQGELEFGARF